MQLVNRQMKHIPRPIDRLAPINLQSNLAFKYQRLRLKLMAMLPDAAIGDLIHGDGFRKALGFKFLNKIVSVHLLIPA